MKEYIIRFEPSDNFNPSTGYFDNLVINDIARTEGFVEACNILNKLNFRIEEAKR